MQIELLFDTQAQGAPQSFRDAIQAAADILDATFVDNITVNITVGYGEIQGTPVTGGSAEGGPVNGILVDYSQTLGLVKQDFAGAVQSGLNALPAGSSVQGEDEVAIWSAEEKALGFLSATATGVDGNVGFATDISTADLIGVALHELTHAMGRIPYGPQPDIFDLFRYTAQGTLDFYNGPTPAPAAYFSLDGGATDIADYGITSDPSDFLNSSGRTPNDAFNEFYDSNTFDFLTPIDILQMETLGFHVGAKSVSDYLGEGHDQFLLENSANRWLDLVQFSAGGQAQYSFVATLGQFSFVGTGDYLAEGHDQFLLRDISGGLEIGDFVGGKATFAHLGTIANQWVFEGTGDYLGEGHDQFLIEQAGIVYLGQLSGGALSLTKETTIATSWAFHGTGDYLGLDHDQFLIENSNGALDLGQFTNGKIGFTSAGTISTSWMIVATGDFLGEGHDQFIAETADGTLELGDFNGGALAFTNEGGLTSSWKFVETGDFLGNGHDQFMIQNASGVVELGDFQSGHLHLTRVADLGSTWMFH